MHAGRNTWLKKTRAVCHSVTAGGHAGSLLTLLWKLLHSVMGGSSQSSKLGLLGPLKWAVCVAHISGAYISISSAAMALAGASIPAHFGAYLLQSSAIFITAPPRHAHLAPWPPCPPPPLLRILKLAKLLVCTHLLTSGPMSTLICFDAPYLPAWVLCLSVASLFPPLTCSDFCSPTSIQEQS